MPDDNRIDAEITAAVRTQILTKIQEILDLIPFRLNLTPDEKRSIPTIAENRAGMVEVFMQQMAANPQFVPTYVNMTHLNRDAALFTTLHELFSAAAGLLESLTDTRHVAGSDMMLAFLAYYNNLKEAGKRNVPGVDALLAQLRPFFARATTPIPPTPTP